MLTTEPGMTFTGGTGTGTVHIVVGTGKVHGGPGTRPLLRYDASDEQLQVLPMSACGEALYPEIRLATADTVDCGHCKRSTAMYETAPEIHAARCSELRAMAGSG
jgi:hypothetical protein